MKKALLDQVLEKAIEEALAGLATRAKTMVEEALGAALEARLKTLLGEAQAIPIAIPEASVRAKAKAAKVQTTLEATLAEATPKATPRKRKTKAATLEDDLAAILKGVELALEKYRGITTPRGKELPDVLYRRVKKTLEHARDLGRADLASLARSALAYIHADPKGVAMGSWQALAGRLGLPVPVAQAA